MAFLIVQTRRNRESVPVEAPLCAKPQIVLRLLSFVQGMIGLIDPDIK
jgi:hypothetical protein